MFVEFKSQWLSIVQVLFYFLFDVTLTSCFFPVVFAFNRLFSNSITL